MALNLTIMPGFFGSTTISRRWVFGRVCFRKSSAFWSVSGARRDKPVTLPPGFPRLWTNPAPTGSAETAMTIGIVLVTSLAAWLGGRVHRNNDIHILSDKLASEGAKTVELTVCITIDDANGLSFNPSKFTQTLAERIYLSRNRRVCLAG